MLRQEASFITTTIQYRALELQTQGREGQLRAGDNGDDASKTEL